jgi:hypothetical protein
MMTFFNGEIGNTVRKIEPFFKDSTYIIQTPLKKNDLETTTHFYQ